MKWRFTVLVVLGMALVLFAADVPYDVKRPPRVPLPVAYAQAMEALGPYTNNYHCVGASLTTMFSPQGGWMFSFCSTNGKPKGVVVPFGEKPFVQEDVIR
jgi:hypothetical protein